MNEVTYFVSPALKDFECYSNDYRSKVVPRVISSLSEILKDFFYWRKQNEANRK